MFYIIADDDGDGLFDEDCVKVMPSKSCFMYVFEIFTDYDLTKNVSKTFQSDLHENQIMICIHVVLYKQQTHVQ